MSEKIKNSPKLRFPEFVNDGEWEEQELGKLGKFLGGGTPSKSVDEYWHGTIPWISSSDLNEDDLKTISITRFVNEKSILKSATKIVPKGSVLFVSRVGTGKLAINSIDLCTSQDFTNFVPTKIYNYFLGYYFLANKSALTSLDQGTSIKGFSKSDLEKFKLIYPKIPNEQQKIADCLSSIDSLISAQSQKVELLKEHKKALIQQLFPQDGEEVPKLRFPEFKNAPKWEEKTLGDVARFFKGKNISKSDISEKALTPCLRYGELYTHYQETIKEIFSKTNLPVSQLVFSQKNDVLIPSSGETKIDIATASCVMLDNIALGGDINIIRSNQNGIFLSYYLNSSKKMDIAKIAQGDTVVHLYSSQLQQLNISFPSLQEQQKIADFLSSIDEQIGSQTRKLQTLKEHKKALMQQLFPSKEAQ